MSKKRGRELREAVKATLEQLHVQDMEFGQGGKHQYVEFTVRDKKCRYSFSLTPAAGKRTMENTVAGVRRLWHQNAVA